MDNAPPPVVKPGIKADVQLWQCKTREQQQAWVRVALLKGRVVTDSGLWLGGVDRPEALIAALRKSGLQVETTRKRVVDAAGQEHNDLAWKAAAREKA